MPSTGGSIFCCGSEGELMISLRPSLLVLEEFELFDMLTSLICSLILFLVNKIIFSVIEGGDHVFIDR